jgi:Ca2+-binding RTX toxin-like protein
VTSTSAVWESGDFRIVVSGSGLSAAGAGTVTGVRVYEVDLSGAAPVDVLVASNTSALSFSFAQLLATIDSDEFFFQLPAFLLQGSDSITGSASEDQMVGYGGNDTIVGAAGNDFLTGDSFDTTAAFGNDSLVGGDGLDFLDGGRGADTMVGGTGDDAYVVTEATDVVVEVAGQGLYDRVTFSDASGLSTYTLAANVENLNVAHGNTATILTARGNAAANKITVEPSFDLGSGTIGREALYGLGGNDRLFAANGNDTLDGGTGNDSMYGGTGNDLYVVDSALDRIFESSTLASEIDSVNSSVSWTLGANLERLTLTGTAATSGTGNALANTLTGNTAANALNGGAGNDTVSGGSGNDTISGSTGNDVLIGGAGNDSLTGGTGADFFRFAATLSAATNVDRLADFVAADDRIDLDDAFFASVSAAGALSAAAFRAGAAAADSSDRVIYNSATGQLLYDADGSGAGAAVLFGTVAAGTAITVADFWVV